MNDFAMNHNDSEHLTTSIIEYALLFGKVGRLA